MEFVRSPFPTSLPASPAASPTSPSSDSSPTPFLECGDHNVVYSSDGALLCIPTPSCLRVYSTATFPPSLLHSLPRPGVRAVTFSPHHSFLLSYERKGSASGGGGGGGGAEANVWLWSTATGERLRGWHWARDVNVEMWPIQWTSDEAVMGVQVTNELQLYGGALLHQAGQGAGSAQQRLLLPHFTQFSISPASAPPYSFAVFTPAKTTGPARITLHALHPLDFTPASSPTSSSSPSSSPSAPPTLLSKSMYKAEEMSIRWSANGQHCLCETKTSTDQSGRSYYGESHLHLFSLSPPPPLSSPSPSPSPSSSSSPPPFTCSVDFSGNGGPVQDFTFHPSSPRGDFVVVQGYQPAVTSHFSIDGERAVAIKQYGKSPRNLLRCSPNGRFLLLGGFGNLAGEMDLFDTLQFKKVGEAQDRDGVKSVEWTPDSRWVVLAVTRPWRRVENGFKVFSYGGELCLHRKYDELYQVAVQPIKDATTIFPNRPASPGLKERRKAAAAAATTATASSPSASSSSSSPSSSSLAPSPTSSYVPPHLRGRQGADAINVVSAMIKGDRGSEGHKKIAGAGAGGAAKQPQPAQPQQRKGGDGKAGGKSKAAKEPTASADPAAASPTPSEEVKQTGGSVAEVKGGDAAADAAAAAVTASVSSLSADACERRVKAANKKLKQIGELQSRLQRGEALDEAQRAKVQSLAEVEEELERLRERLQALHTNGG